MADQLKTTEILAQVREVRNLMVHNGSDDAGNQIKEINALLACGWIILLVSPGGGKEPWIGSKQTPFTFFNLGRID